jgi:ankyrin repeat protein
MLELLLKYGAQLKQKNSAVNLLLIALVSEQPPELIKRLIELGENVNFKAGNSIAPLMLAAMFYKSDIAELLIQKGAKINEYDVTGWSPLFYACHYFSEPRAIDVVSFQPRNRDKSDANATVQLLLQNAADGSTLDDFGASPMTGAGAWANAGTIRLLLKAGGKRALNASDKHNRNAILYAASCNPDLKAVEALLQAGAAPNTIMKEGKYSERIMKFAQFHGSFNGPEHFCVTSENKFHNCAGFGWYDPPLYDAIRMRNTTLVKLLLKYDADPNLQYKREGDKIYTPLTFYYAPSAEIEQILVNAGAKYDIAQGKRSIGSREIEQEFAEVCKGDNLSAVKVLYARLPKMTPDERKSFLRYPLTCAARQGILETVKFLIQENGGTFENTLMLSAAANAEHPEIIRYLTKIKPAALKEARSIHDQCSVMHYAASPVIIDFLIGESFDVNIRNGRGETPLIWQFPSENNSYLDYDRGAVLKALIRRGADINAQDNFGNNAAAKAFSSLGFPYDGALKYLLKNGANPDTKIKGKVLLDYAIERNDARKFETLIDASANAALITNDLKDASPYISRRVQELRQNNM